MSRLLLAALLLVSLPVWSAAQVLQQPSPGGGGSGTISSGTSGHAARYTGATTVDDSTGLTLDATDVLTEKPKVTSVSGDTTLGTHNIVYVTTGSTDRTMTLPAASSATVGHYRVIKADSGAGAVLLAPNGTDTLNGVNSSTSITAQWEYFDVLLVSATGWHVTTGATTVNLASEVSGVLPVANGGTGSAPASADQVLVATSSSAGTWRTLPDCQDSAGQHLNYEAGTDTFSCGTSGSGGSGTDYYALSYQPGLLTSVNTTKGGWTRAVKASTVDNLLGSAVTFTCSGNPVMTLYNCGPFVACANPVTIGSATVTSAGTPVAATISNPDVGADHYLAWAISSGTCTALDIAGVAQLHVNAAQPDLTTGLVGHWTLDEASGTTAADATANNLDGTLKPTGNEGTFTTSSILGSHALALAHSPAQFVEVADAAALDLTGQLTLATWLYITAFDTGAAQDILGKTDCTGSCPTNYSLYITPSGYIGVFFTNPGGTYHKREASTHAVPATTWTHVAATYNLAQTRVRLYVNGVLTTSSDTEGSPTTTALTTNAGSLTLGAFDVLYPDTGALKGRLDDVRIYNRELSGADILGLYHLGGPS